MDHVSYIETCRLRIRLRERGLQLANSKCNIDAGGLRRLNWNVISGVKIRESLLEYQAILTAVPDAELLTCFGLSYSDAFPLVFVAMCDTWRRLWLPTQRCETQILGLHFMSLDEASAHLRDLADQNRPCCHGDPCTKAGQGNKRSKSLYPVQHMTRVCDSSCGDDPITAGRSCSISQRGGRERGSRACLLIW